MVIMLRRLLNVPGEVMNVLLAYACVFHTVLNVFWLNNIVGFAVVI